MRRFELKDGLKELMSNYCFNKYKREWDYVGGLSFKYDIKEFLNGRNLMNKLWKRIEKECFVAGIYVMEFGSNDKMNIHFLMMSEKNYKGIVNLFKKYWGKNYGVFWLEEFDREKGDYDLYMLKDYWKEKKFDYDFISNVY